MVRNPLVRFGIAFAFIVALELAGVAGMRSGGAAVAPGINAFMIGVALVAGAINAAVPLEIRRSKRAIVIATLIVFALLAAAFSSAR